MALSPKQYKGGKTHLKMREWDAFTALMSSEESCPQLAKNNCKICVIGVKIPANIFMERALSQELIYSEEAYTGNKTILWSAESYEGCEVSFEYWDMKALGTDAWAAAALGRWYKSWKRECSDCSAHRMCWAGHKGQFGGTSPRCSECWNAMYMDRLRANMSS